MLDLFSRFLHPLRQRIALLKSAKLIFLLLKFIVSEYDSFRFSFNFSASFWMVFVEPSAAPPAHAKISGTQFFVEPSAAPPAHAKISGTQLLCSTSRILCWYFNVLTLS